MEHIVNRPKIHANHNIFEIINLAYIKLNSQGDQSALIYAQQIINYF
jgi:hypothetical protein